MTLQSITAHRCTSMGTLPEDGNAVVPSCPAVKATKWQLQVQSQSQSQSRHGPLRPLRYTTYAPPTMSHRWRLGMNCQQLTK